MHTVYNIEVDCEAVKDNLYRLGNQIFKLLPMREEDKDWRKPLETLIIELLGMGNLAGRSHTHHPFLFRGEQTHDGRLYDRHQCHV